jgi:hypothetical protein
MGWTSLFRKREHATRQNKFAGSLAAEIVASVPIVGGRV